MTAECRRKIFRPGRKPAACIPSAFERPVENAVVCERGVRRTIGPAAQQWPLGLHRTLGFTHESVAPNAGINPFLADPRFIALAAIAIEKSPARPNQRALDRSVAVRLEPRVPIGGAA